MKRKTRGAVQKLKSNEKQGYHKKLKLMYTVKMDGVLFSDGVFYKTSEALILKNNPGFDYDIIHEAKKMFNAEVVNV